ncbi:hypothetical protein AMECASPLE_025726 [Ameca splendens]|uniref:Uncharacterized protein n=1 Tax=Ameca splendens TaxID=208324 RepID=A0ABV0XHU8_9TELE
MVGVLAFSWCSDRPSVPPACPSSSSSFSSSAAAVAAAAIATQMLQDQGFCLESQEVPADFRISAADSGPRLSPDLPVHQSEAEAAKVSSFQFFIEKLDLIVSPGRTNRTVSSRISFYIRATFISALKSEAADI